MEAVTHIHIKGAREHNLKNLELKIPRGRLVVITGVSGSGKSSLAFDTIYAEGYRKYIESLSTQARQILEQLKRPDVDFIHGLSPVLAIEQRTGGSSPRSTIATVTEIADYARLLWTLAGEQLCPRDGGKVERRSLDENVSAVLEAAAGRKVVLMARWMRAKASVLRDELPRLRLRGFQRVRIHGEIRSLDEPKLLPAGTGEVDVDLVVDRLVGRPDQRSRLADSLELAFREGRDRALALVEKEDGSWDEISLSQNLACVICGDVFEPVTPRRLSFNKSEGACPECGGLGQKLAFAPELVVPDPDKSTRDGAIKPWRIGGKNLIIRNSAILKQLAEQLPFDPDKPWRLLDEEVRRQILFGTGERLFSFRLRRMKQGKLLRFPGVIHLLHESWQETKSDGFRARLAAFQVTAECPACGGGRLNPRSASVLTAGRNLPDFFRMNVTAAASFLAGLEPAQEAGSALNEVLPGVRERLRFLSEVGLGYLSLDREYATLSGGEAQRVRLATQLGMGLTGVIYVLDEPSIGLHPQDNRKLLQTLIELRDRGNSLLVVEHDEETMLAADHLIELGPGAGTEGGEVLFSGPPQACMKLGPSASGTGPFLSGKLSVLKDANDLKPDERWLTVRGAAQHNLRDVDIAFPVGLLTCVTGVSGSGKSTLVNEILAPAAARRLNLAKAIPGRHRGIEGLDHFERVVRVDQEPIGRSPRSNPATYVKLFDLLRDLFSKAPLSRVRGYKPTRFSFNVRGGRCERCQGAGQIRLDMQFLSDAYTECPACEGRRYNRETLEVRFHGHTIADVLDMTVREAAELFRNIPRIMEKLETLEAVGLGYVQLGQSAITLSGGEAQRLKLSLELSKRQQGRTLYLLDEPTTGLHWSDIQKLMDLLFKLRDAGNTVIIIEHNLDVINIADWTIDLGPGGGDAGGGLVFTGPPEALAAENASLTGVALGNWRKRRGKKGK